METNALISFLISFFIFYHLWQWVLRPTYKVRTNPTVNPTKENPKLVLIEVFNGKTTYKQVRYPFRSSWEGPKPDVTNLMNGESAMWHDSQSQEGPKWYTRRNGELIVENAYS